MANGNERKRPSFLGIGAPRSGTTWLHHNLRSHPQIWLPPLKELHYFDMQRRGAARLYPIRRTDVRFLGRQWPISPWLLGRFWYLKHARSLLGGRRAQAGLGWRLRYMFGFRSDRWYASLFRDDCVSGEITPGYMLLARPVIEDVYKLNPDMKIVLLLRDPVSRAWSSARKQLRNRLKRTSEEPLRQLVDSPGFRLRGDYVTAVNNWRSVFGEQQVFIGFFDDLVKAPRGLLRSIYRFLGVSADDEFVPATAEKVFSAGSGPARELPEGLRAHMYAGYLDQLRELAKMLGGPVSKWLANAEEAAAGAASKA
jgi:hypothetical protein